MANEIQEIKVNPTTKLPARAKVRKFLHKISLGESRFSAFKETFPVSENWSTKKVYNHINRILMAESSKSMLTDYRAKMIELFDGKKLDMISWLEEKIFTDASLTFSDKLKAIDQYTKLMDSFNQKNINVLNNINITNETNKANRINEIFGIEEAEVITDE